MASRPPGTPILGGQGVGVGGVVGSTAPGGSIAAAASGASGVAGAGPGVAASIVGGIGGTAGQTAAMAAAAVAARNANLSALQEIEEGYNKRLDMDVNQLMESFGDIIKVANITYTDSSYTKDKYKLAQESYQIQGRATNIVSSAESLLAMVTELKQTLLLNDTSTLAELSTRRQMELTIQKTAVKQRVVGLKEEVDRTIWELEQTCYGTASVTVQEEQDDDGGANSLKVEDDALQ